MSRRQHRRRSRPADGLRQGEIAIRITGDQGTGKTTLLNAVKLLIEDAGGTASFALRGGHTGEPEDFLVARLGIAALDELGAWMADEPA
jgi:ABC-type iron transport system FetAB ATPase subunit